MISKQAIKDYLGRDFDDFYFLKKATKEELLEGLSGDLAPRDLVTDPWKHQLACITLGLTLPKFLFLLEMGTGKTLITLAVIAARKRAGTIRKSLVVTVNQPLAQSWVDEAALHSPDLTVSALVGTKKQREAALELDADVYVVNYGGLFSLLTSLEEVTGKKKKKGAKRERAIDDGAVGALSKRFDCLVVDEIHRAKNHNSLTHKLIKKLGSGKEYKYGLTGTPTGVDPLDLWAQFFLIDDGETLGTTLGKYRQAFFDEQKVYTNNRGFASMRYRPVEYKFKKKMKATLRKMLRHRSISYELEECQDLPEVVNKTLRFDIPSSTKTYYDKLCADMREVQGDHTQVKGVFHHMRQLASGFLMLANEDGEKAHVTFPENPKINLLSDIIEDIPSSSKFIIFHHYKYSATLIRQLLKKRGIRFAEIRGGISDPIAQIEKFKTDKEVQALIANNDSGGTGHNLQVANYAIYFESPVSPRERRQTLGRIRRGTQTKTMYCIDMLMRDSVEDKIMSNLMEGKALHEALFDVDV